MILCCGDVGGENNNNDSFIIHITPNQLITTL